MFRREPWVHEYVDTVAVSVCCSRQPRLRCLGLSMVVAGPGRRLSLVPDFQGGSLDCLCGFDFIPPAGSLEAGLCSGSSGAIS